MTAKGAVAPHLAVQLAGRVLLDTAKGNNGGNRQPATAGTGIMRAKGAVAPHLAVQPAGRVLLDAAKDTAEPNPAAQPVEESPRRPGGVGFETADDRRERQRRGTKAAVTSRHSICPDLPELCHCRRKDRVVALGAMAADAVRQVMLKGGMFMLPPTPDRAHPYGRPPPDAAHDARPKWLDRLRYTLRSRRYSRGTEQTWSSGHRIGTASPPRPDAGAEEGRTQAPRAKELISCPHNLTMLLQWKAEGTIAASAPPIRHQAIHWRRGRLCVE